MFQLVSVAEETGLKLALSETPFSRDKAHFIYLYVKKQLIKTMIKSEIGNRPLSHYRILPVSRDIGWPVQQLDYFRYMKL